MRLDVHRIKAFGYLCNLNKIQSLSKKFMENVNYSQLNFDVN